MEASLSSICRCQGNSIRIPCNPTIHRFRCRIKYSSPSFTRTSFNRQTLAEWAEIDSCKITTTSLSRVSTKMTISLAGISRFTAINRSSSDSKSNRSSLFILIEKYNRKCLKKKKYNHNCKSQVCLEAHWLGAAKAR
jgi:hypothetical protein